jgi:hypothetical protein
VLGQPYAVGAMCVVAAVIMLFVARLARANAALIDANIRARVLEARAKGVNEAARARKATDAARRKGFVNPLQGPRRGGAAEEEGEEGAEAKWRPAPPRGTLELRAAAAAMKLGAPRVPLARLRALQARSVASGAASGSSRLLQLLAAPPEAPLQASADGTAPAALLSSGRGLGGDGVTGGGGGGEGPDGGATRLQQQRGSASSRTAADERGGARGGASSSSVAASARSAMAWLRPKRAASRSLSEFSPDDGDEGGWDEEDGEGEGEEGEEDGIDDGAPTVTAGSGVAALAALAARRDRGGRPPQHFRMAELVQRTVDSMELINARLEGMRDDVNEGAVRERERERQERERELPEPPGEAGPAALARTKAQRAGLVRQVSVVTWADHSNEDGLNRNEGGNLEPEPVPEHEQEPEPGDDGGDGSDADAAMRH